MSERYTEALAELRELVREMHHESEQSSYGHFHGGDPRNFSPDPECSTDAEREAHRLACEQWNSGKREPLPGPHEPLSDGRIGWVTKAGFGLGVSTYIDEQARDWAERAERILDRLEDDRP